MRMASAGVAVAILLMAEGDASAGMNCTCRTTEGAKVDEGAVACLHLSKGDQLARCEMLLNNPSWTKIRDGCPTTSVAMSSRPDSG